MPKALVKDLSDDARKVHAHVARAGGATYLRYDPLEGPRFVASSQDDELEVTPRLQSAVDEITAANLGTWDGKYRSLRVRSLARNFTIAPLGRGDQYIEVTILDHRYGCAGNGALLACLPGAALTAHVDRAWPVWDVDSWHPTATDFEHASARIAMLRLGNPAVISTHGTRLTEYIGTLTEAQLYPTGVDPTTTTDRDTRENGPCDRCDIPHPFAPYLPPARDELDDLLPALVKVSVYPLSALVD